MKNTTGLSRMFFRFFLSAAFLLSAAAGFAGSAAAAKNPIGAVYTLSNAAAGNSVLAYSRGSDGSLSFQGAFAAGGNGSGASLGSQGALALTEDNRWLLAVDAGSNQVSVFAVTPTGLTLTDVASSGGSMPVSVTSYANMVYVLNEGGSGNISGFWLSDTGALSPISGSSRFLSNGGVGAAPGAAQVSFSPDGTMLVVTEKATNQIDTFAVNNGVAGPVSVHPSSGPTPYGFGFNQAGFLVVSEAFGGAPLASAASSYSLANGQFSLVSGSVPTTQTAACWIAISKNGKFAYAVNAASASISSYSIGSDGSLSLVNGAAAHTGAGAVDAAFSNNGAFLYDLNSGAHMISAYAMQSDGSLVAIGAFGVPAGVAGIAAR